MRGYWMVGLGATSTIRPGQPTETESEVGFVPERSASEHRRKRVRYGKDGVSKVLPHLGHGSPGWLIRPLAVISILRMFDIGPIVSAFERAGLLFDFRAGYSAASTELCR